MDLIFTRTLEMRVFFVKIFSKVIKSWGIWVFLAAVLVKTQLIIFSANFIVIPKNC